MGQYSSNCLNHSNFWLSFLLHRAILSVCLSIRHSICLRATVSALFDRILQYHKKEIPGGPDVTIGYNGHSTQDRIRGHRMRPPHHVLTRLFPRRPSLVTPFPSPLITPYHVPLPSSTPGGLNSRKDAFSRIRENGLRMDGRYDGRTDRRTDRRTDTPCYIELRGRIK